MIKVLLFITSFLLLVKSESFSQEKITLTDVGQIQYNAQHLVMNDYMDFLNSIATENNQKILDEMILNSFTEMNRIFDSSSVVIQDDVDPTHTSLNAHPDIYDRRVKEYLSDFSVFYIKSKDASVQFTLDRISNVKSSKTRIYVMVYFSSFFRNKSKAATVPYQLNTRFAEVTVRRLRDGWVPTISRIGFYKQADTLNDFTNDITIASDTTAGGTGNTASITKDIDFFEKRKREKIKEAVDNQNKITEQFNKLMDDGDNAFDKKNFVDALTSYRNAKDIKPYDKTAITKINMVLEQVDKEGQAKSKNFDIYVQRAKDAKSKRDLPAAIKYYRSARELDQDKALSFASEMKELNSRNDNLYDMRELYKDGKYSDAVSRYSTILKKADGISNAEKSDYYNGRGMCYDKMNDTKKALKDFSTAIELDGDNVEAFINRAATFKKNQQFSEAISDHNKAINRYDQNPVNYLELADLRVLKNQRADAIAALDDGLKFESLKAIPDLYFKRGQLFADDKSWKKAVEDFTAVVSIDPNNALGYYNRGFCYLAMNKVKDAADDFEKSRKAGLDSSHIYYINNVAEENYLRSDKSFQNGSMDSAVTLIDYAISLNPASDKYRYTKGNYMFDYEKYNEAIVFYDQAIDINVNNGDAYYKRGLCYHMIANHKKAVEDLTKAIAYNNTSFLAAKAMGDALLSLNEFSNAASKYKSALVLITKQKGNFDRVDAEINDSLGKAFYKLGNYDESINALKISIKKDPDFVDAYYNVGLSYYSAGKQDDAISNLNTAVTKDKKNIYYNYYLAKAYQAAKKYPEAATFYGVVIAKDSNHMFKEAILNRAISFYEIRDFKSALPDYLESQSAGLELANNLFNYQLGTVYLNLNPPNSDSALFYLDRQYRSDSSNGLVAYGIGVAYVQKGRLDDAMIWLEKTLQLKTFTPKKLRNDAMLTTILNDKRFKDLLKKYN